MAMKFPEEQKLQKKLPALVNRTVEVANVLLLPGEGSGVCQSKLAGDTSKSKIPAV